MCGTNGITYACGQADAFCHGVHVAHAGECGGALDGGSAFDAGGASPCVDNGDCTGGDICYPPTSQCQPECNIACLVYDPVCGTDGVTYGCGAEDAYCHGANPWYPGPCSRDGGASSFDAGGATPCSSNGDCTGRDICYPPTSACQPACQIACLVPDPVCGSDGITYTCGREDAYCHGATVLHDGACRNGLDAGSGCSSNADCGRQICYPPTSTCQDACSIACLRYDPVCGDDGVTYACGAQDAWCQGVNVAHQGECDPADAGVPAPDGGPLACRDNGDCASPDVCYPPTHTCQPSCEVRCFRYDPVCGSDGVTYACGESDAWCHGATVVSSGECTAGDAGPPPPPGCLDNGDCGTDLVCYPPTSTCQPACEVRCLRYDPVCASDGVTYACGEPDAWCHGARVLYAGECQGATDGGSGGAGACRTNSDCVGRGEICYPPTSTCQDSCEVLCLVPDPVCGTDGVTYSCGQADAWCHGAEVLYDGACLPSM